mmetsp:Transcript_4637/g.11647  ORF Transcript_4637/g.11647 Transcript_4637/m.11647 type:complete len:542 (+) Transcript_4637:535-2160(+)
MSPAAPRLLSAREESGSVGSARFQVSLLRFDDSGVLAAILSRLRVLCGRVFVKLDGHRLRALLQHHLELVQHPVRLGALASDERRGHTLLPRAARAANPMRVRLDVLRHVVVDHVLHALDVDASPRDVGGDEDLVLAALEALDGQLARRLVLARVDGRRREALLVERAREDVAPLLPVAEDDDGRWRPVGEQVEQLVFLLVLLEHEDVLRDVVLGRRLVADVHIRRSAKVPLGDALDGRRHCGGEHVRLPVDVLVEVDDGVLIGRLEVGGGHRVEDCLDLRLEAHVDHLVRLVKDDVVALVQHHVPPIQRVVETARCGHHDLNPLRLDERLLFDAQPAHHRVHTNLQFRRELARLLLDLLHELARRRHDERERPLARVLARDRRLLEDVHEHRQHEGARLAGAGLRDADHVLAREAERDALHLHARRTLVLGFRHRLEDRLGQSGLVPVAEGADLLARRRVARAPLRLDLVVLAEDAPVALGHLVERLLRVVLRLLVLVHHLVERRLGVHHRQLLLQPLLRVRRGEDVRLRAGRRRRRRRL